MPGGSAGGAVAVAVVSCLLLALLSVLASLGYSCPRRYVNFVRRSLRLRLDSRQSTTAGIKTSSSYVAPLAANDSRFSEVTATLRDSCWTTESGIRA